MVNSKQNKETNYINGIQTLAFKITNTNYKTICFSSLNPQEGKTTIVEDVAKALLSLQKKVCVIDVDMLQEKENTTSVMLSDYLRQSVNLQELIAKEDYYDVIKSSFDSDSTALLSSERFIQLLEELERHYDYILLDAPSLETTIDAQIVSKKSDALILIIESERNVKEKLERAVLNLTRNDINIMGSVLNKFN